MRALSLFSGCGGLDIGVERAGFENIASIESDPNAAASLRNWYGKQGATTEVIEQDIREVDPSRFLTHGIDLLHGGPPCQAFSLIGKRNSLRDPRGQLLFEVIRFAERLRPKAILMEQVKGLLSARGEDEKPGSVFRSFVEKLELLGYISKWQVINAAEYGIPQLRQRLFLVATYGKNGFNFPISTHSADTFAGSLFPKKPFEGVGTYIKALPLPVLKAENPLVPNHIDVTPSRDKERISYVPEGGFLAGQNDAPPSIRLKLTKKDTTKFRRLSFDAPSLTLRGGEIFYHPTDNRYLTPREYLRIHTFPDEFELVGPIRSRSGSVRNLDQHRQVANSVPPQLAYIIAKEVKKAI